MADKLRWGFLAAGSIANVVAADLQNVAGAEITAVSSRTQASAQALAERFGVSKVYTDNQALVDDPEVDVVYVSSPHTLHYEHTLLALQAGKHVLCEKPFTINAGQLEELVALARQKKLFLMEAMWTRYLPVIVKLRQLLAEGAIGEVTFFYSSFNTHLDLGPEHRIYNPALGGGALLDLGVYPVSLASMVFGAMPNQIASMSNMGATGVDEQFAALLKYGEGRFASVSAGARNYVPQDTVICGSQGELRLPSRHIWRYDNLVLTRHGQEPETFNMPLQGKGYGYQIQEVLDCIHAGQLESAVMPLDESLNIMRTMDAMRAQWGFKYPGE